MLDVKTVTVVGATGTMGSNVAGIFASFGEAKVYCVGRDIGKVKKTIPRIVKSVRADAISNKLVPADFTMLEECVASSDLVFESSAENMSIKADIARRVGLVLPDKAISCTGTSGLSINDLAACYPENARRRFFGVHMFNPPYVMSLCELISNGDADDDVREQLREYLEHKLNRTVVEVRDAPAFLGNRIGFQFINEALQYAERYRDSGGIDYIDAIIGPFTGRAMSPITTSDFVGLDVHKAIVDNVYLSTSDFAHDTFVLPSYVQKLIDDGALGRKAGKGLYQLIRHENGLRRRMVYDIESSAYRDVIPYVFPFAERMKEYLSEGDYDKAFDSLVSNHSQEANICISFMLKYIVYSLYASKEIGYHFQAADDVMATGFNWCPPLAMYDALSMVVDVPALIKERLPEVCSLVDMEALIERVGPSKYDYRPFFRSGR